MNKFHFDSPKDFLALLVRRKWWVIVPTTFMPMLVLFVALVLPAIYVSQSLILIEPKEVPDDFVKDLISVDSDQRLDAIRETVLSRTNLLRVYREFSERLPELARLNNLARLESLRKGILIEFERPRGRAPIQYFRVSYENRSPETAQQIARRLAELFISYDNKTREEQVFGTAEFLSAELEKAQSKLGRADEALAEFKRNHRYELPDQLDTNLRTLDRLEEERKTQRRSSGPLHFHATHCGQADFRDTADHFCSPRRDQLCRFERTGFSSGWGVSAKGNGLSGPDSPLYRSASRCETCPGRTRAAQSRDTCRGPVGGHRGN